MNVTFESDGILTTELDRLIGRIKRPPTLNRDVIGDAIRGAIAENFSNESGDGGRWRALSPVTVRERQKRGFPGEHPILVQTGKLLDSLTNPNAAQHIDQVTVFSDGFAIDIGSSDERVPKLDQGEDRIPARPFLALDDQQLDRVGDAVEAYFGALFNL